MNTITKQVPLKKRKVNSRVSTTHAYLTCWVSLIMERKERKKNRRKKKKWTWEWLLLTSTSPARLASSKKTTIFFYKAKKRKKGTWEWALLTPASPAPPASRSPSGRARHGAAFAWCLPAPSPPSSASPPAPPTAPSAPPPRCCCQPGTSSLRADWCPGGCHPGDWQGRVGGEC